MTRTRCQKNRRGAAEGQKGAKINYKYSKRYYKNVRAGGKLFV
jgi:hypothetical protein